MSAVNPSIALLELLERRVRRRNNAFRRRASLLVGGGLLLAVIVVTLAAPLLTSYDPNEIDPLHPLAAPFTGKRCRWTAKMRIMMIPSQNAGIAYATRNHTRATWSKIPPLRRAE